MNKHAGLAIGLLVWAACAGALALAGLRRAADLPPLSVGKPLVGATVQVPPPAWSWDGFVHGRVQAAVSRAVGAALPVFPLAVRLRNQVDWTLLGTAATPGLMLGTGRRLAGLEYAQAFCSRDEAAARPAQLEWAGRIRQMQDIVERRGHAFLYVLTPSKVSQYPDILPRDYACPASAADRAGFVPAWLATLRAAGVHVADTTAPLMDAHPDYPFPLFPRDGVHWNGVGQAIGTQAVVSAMMQLLPGWDVAPLSFAWTMSKHPIPPDNDLGEIANLLRPPDAPSPLAVATNPVATGPCRAPHLAIVGGSFSQQLEIWLSRLPCSVPVVLYFYWQVLRMSADGRDVFGGGPVDPLERERTIRNADLLIYEENEQVLGIQNHGTALWRTLTAEP